MTVRRWSIQCPQTLEVDGVRELRIAIVAGRLDIIAHDEPVTRIRISQIEGDPLLARYQDGWLDIRHGIGEPSTWSERATWCSRTGACGPRNRVVLSIAVPAATIVDAGTISGEGLVSGLAGRIKIASVSGSVMTDATSGSLHASTVSGEAIVRNHDGDLAVNSVSGEITASGRFSTIKANTVTGNLTFDALSVPEKVSTNSVSGNVLIRLPEQAAVDLSVTSAAGTVTLNDERISLLGISTRTFGDPAAPRVQLRTASISGDTAVVNRSSAGLSTEGRA